MIWVAWRQQRAEVLLGAALLAVLAALFIPTGVHMNGAYESDGAASCVATQATGCANCSTPSMTASRRSSASPDGSRYCRS